MHILFISNYFPPEVNAPATRLFEHAKQWVKDGHEVEVLVSVPNFPEGRVYEGYKNAFSIETKDGIRIVRVPMYVTANVGTLKRTLSFLSYMVSAWWYARRLKKPDVVVATSPQFFAAVGGYFIAKRMRAPFVLEIRDLWPESIVAVGAVNRNFIIRMFERLEKFLYVKADHIVALTNAFKKFIAAKNISPDKISVIKNGADLDAWSQPLDPEKIAALRTQHNLEDKFVVSYIGTIGMAHRADVMLEAAQRCDDPDIVFLVVGAGAERAKLEQMHQQLQLPNFRLLGKVSKQEVRYLLDISDVSVVHLKASSLFKTVIPSKIFEAMATKTPIILGVEGEVKEIIEEANAGLTIQPENADQLAQAALTLKSDPALYAQIAADGNVCVHEQYDRSKLAQTYSALLEQIALGTGQARDSRPAEVEHV